MAILTLSGRAALAASIKSRAIHLAWGRGDESWDTASVPEPIEATALESEIGRKVANAVRYCIPDPMGEIVVPNGRFRETTDVTNHLFFRFNFEFGDSPSEVVREVAIFVGTETETGLPVGQTYFFPEQLTDAGILLVLERFPRFNRSSAVRQAFEFVVTI